MERYATLPPQVLALMTPLRLGISLADRESIIEITHQLRVRAAREGKFTKLQVFYTPVTLIPPLAWFYECSTCEFYLWGSRTCQIVQGSIEPYAWCGLWINRPEDQPFSWLGRAIGLIKEPDNAS